MKRIIFYSIILSTLFLDCTNSDVDQKQANSIVLDSLLSNHINNFIKTYDCKQCINDITIDKITPDSTIITIRAMTPYKNYFQENPKRQKIIISKIPFFLYTGAEEFLNNILVDTNTTVSTESTCQPSDWTIIRSKGIDTLITYGGVPFYYPDFRFPRTNVEFIPID